MAKSRRKRTPKTVLKLPDLEHSKSAVLNSLTSASSKSSYEHAIREFIDWYCSEPRLAFNRTVVTRYRIALEQHSYAPSTINLRLAAIRRLAYEASDCTGDRKIHYLTGVAYEGPDDVVGGERLTLEAGEYAVIHVNDTALLRDTWTWLLGHWLATSGRREKNAPEFERFTSISEAGTPIGPVEIWIPLEPLSRD